MRQSAQIRIGPLTGYISPVQFIQVMLFTNCSSHPSQGSRPYGSFACVTFQLERLSVMRDKNLEADVRKVSYSNATSTPARNGYFCYSNESQKTQQNQTTKNYNPWQISKQIAKTQNNHQSIKHICIITPSSPQQKKHKNSDFPSPPTVKSFPICFYTKPLWPRAPRRVRGGGRWSLGAAAGRPQAEVVTEVGWLWHRKSVHQKIHTNRYDI